jgi:magnesium-transporting ATPase (P-type)
MSSSAKEWLIVAAFFVGFFAFTAAETWWLGRRTTHGVGRAFSFAFATNIFTASVGFCVSFVIFGVIMAMAWDGSLTSVPGGDSTIWVAVVVGGLAPLTILVLAKRLMIKLLKLTDLARPWAYAGVASLLFFLSIFLLPFAVAYLL